MEDYDYNGDEIKLDFTMFIHMTDDELELHSNLCMVRCQLFEDVGDSNNLARERTHLRLMSMERVRRVKMYAAHIERHPYFDEFVMAGEIEDPVIKSEMSGYWMREMDREIDRLMLSTYNPKNPASRKKSLR
jgi:hypothetical protein